MFARTLPAAILLSAFAALAAGPASADGPKDNVADNVRPVPPAGNDLPPAVKEEFRAGLAELQQLIKDIGNHDLLPDVLVYEKAVRWALDYNEVYDGKGSQPGANVRKCLKEGLERAKALKAGKTPWATATGYVVRGYRSRIDGSVQPYGLLVPAGYDFAGKEKHRLDFWWHGRGETLSEAAFVGNQQSASGIIPAPGAFILFPYGRYCNANKFAGEVDSFECLVHCRNHYRIDEDRLVARGFSMGGAACWQYAVHYPTMWAAAAPGAGFAETPEFLDIFQNEKVEPTWYEKKLWHMYNATDYAANLFNLPTVAYSGEIDKQKQAADVMAREMKKVGLELRHIIGPKTAHSYEPGARKMVNESIDLIVLKGRDAHPERIAFTTYTLRYNGCSWLTVHGLARHWERAIVKGHRSDKVVALRTENVTRLKLVFPPDKPIPSVLALDGQLMRLSETGTTYAQRDGDYWNSGQMFWGDELRKIPGLQGPIDDAFMDSFVMVRPTGKPMNEKVGDWAAKEMKHAVTHWRSQFRGDAPVKADTEVTDDDIKNSNLILWGDPQSNAVLAKIASKLPVKWDSKIMVIDGQRRELPYFDFGGKAYPTDSFVPVLIYPNPLNPKKYMVLNSGFTFREYDYLNNARQVPKLPDYAVIDTNTPPNSRYPGKVVRAGFFGEKWEYLPNDGQAPTGDLRP